MAAPPPSQKDAGQVLRYAFDDEDGALRVDATISPGGADLEIHYEDDSIAIGDPSTNNILHINSDGSINVDVSGSVVSGDVTITQGGNQAIVTPQGALTVVSTGSSTVTGTVTANEAGLTAFQTSQYNITTTPIQLTPTPLVNRVSLSITINASPNVPVYIGNNSSVSTTTGYPLYNGSTLQLDLTPSGNIWAVSNTTGPIVSVLEIG